MKLNIHIESFGWQVDFLSCLRQLSKIASMSPAGLVFSTSEQYLEFIGEQIQISGVRLSLNPFFRNVGSFPINSDLKMQKVGTFRNTIFGRRWCHFLKVNSDNYLRGCTYRPKYCNSIDNATIIEELESALRTNPEFSRHNSEYKRTILNLCGEKQLQIIPYTRTIITNASKEFFPIKNLGLQINYYEVSDS
jgi:hypothetical protein